MSQSLNQSSKQPGWEPERCDDCGFADFRWIAKSQDRAWNVCGAAQYKPKTPEQLQAQQQRSAREELEGAIAVWGRANDRNWHSAEIRSLTDVVEQYLRGWTHHE